MLSSRALRRGVALGVAGVLGASCGAQDSSTESVATGEAPPVILDSNVSGVSDGAWVAGGAIWGGDDGPWVANQSAVHLSPAGEELATVTLPVRDDEFIHHNSVVGSPSVSPHLVGVVCPLDRPHDYTGLGCGADLRTMFVDLASGEERSVSLPSYERSVGNGLTRTLGVWGDEIIIARTEAAGAYPGTYELGVYAVSTVSDSVRALQLPDTVSIPDSVCLAGDELLFIAPNLNDLLYIDAVDVMAMPVDGPGQWASKATLDLSGKDVQTGGLACSGSEVIFWTQSGEELTITNRDSTTFRQAGRALSFPAPLGIEPVAFRPSDDMPLVPVKDRMNNRSTYFGVDSSGAWSTFGGAERPTGLDSIGVFAGSSVFDADELKRLAFTDLPAGEPSRLDPQAYTPTREG